VTSGRKPIFKVETGLYFPAKVENHYSSIASGLALNEFFGSLGTDFRIIPDAINVLEVMGGILAEAEAFQVVA
jgi:hypothetical protein